MRLSADELVQVKEGGPVKIWRWCGFEGPAHADVGCCYTTAGENFTVLNVQMLSSGDVLLLHGKATYKKLSALGPFAIVWLVEVGKGDRTDQPRFLAHAGFGDAHGYATRQRRTKTGQVTVMLDEPAVSDDVLDAFAAAAESTGVQKRTKRHKKQQLRRLLSRAQKAVDRL